MGEANKTIDEIMANLRSEFDRVASSLKRNRKAEDMVISMAAKRVLIGGEIAEVSLRGEWIEITFKQPKQ